MEMSADRPVVDRPTVEPGQPDGAARHTGGEHAPAHAAAAHAAPERRRPPVIAVILGLTAVLTVLLIAFAWPAARSQPRDLPLAVAGPDAAVAQVSAGL